MSGRTLRDRILRRAKSAGLDLPAGVVDGLECYFCELTKWNKKINLTALALDGDGVDEAIDRLLIEPALAATHVPRSSTSLLDIGSGGGSPAIPLKLCRPDLSLTMVEVKVRKSVFLRQVSRLLALERTAVETSRFEELLVRADLHEAVDVVSIRAVKVEPATMLRLQAFMRPSGLLLHFTVSPDEPYGPHPALEIIGSHTLVEKNRSRLVVFRKIGLD